MKEKNNQGETIVLPRIGFVIMFVWGGGQETTMMMMSVTMITAQGYLPPRTLVKC